MKKMNLLFSLLLLMLLSLAGCGDTVRIYKTDGSSETQNGVHTMIDTKTQKIKFVEDKVHGGMKNIRAGGIMISRNDVLYVKYKSYRFNGSMAADYVSLIDINSEAIFKNLPNTDRWGEYWIVLKSGKEYMVELCEFNKETANGVYSFIDSDSTIEWGAIDDPRAQYGMSAVVDKQNLTVNITGQFGCDTLYGLQVARKFKPGMKVVFSSGGTAEYFSELVQDKDGFLSFSLAGIPMQEMQSGNQYGWGKYISYGKLFVVSPDNEERSEFSFDFNVENNDETFTWYIETNQNGVWSDSYSTSMVVISYNPAAIE